MDFKNSLTYLLTQIAISYKNNLQKSLSEIGLHSGQIFVLISLWESDGQSQIDLAKSLNLSSPTINKMVGILDRNGFVKSRKCEKDGRVVRLYLTEKGVQSKSVVEEKWVSLEMFSVANLTETEKLILLQLILKLKENLNQDIDLFSK